MFIPIRIRIRIGIKAMQILPQVLIMLENQIFLLLVTVLQFYIKCLIFLISVKYIIIFDILDSMLNIQEKISLPTFSYAWN